MNTADLIGSRGLLDRGLASIASAIQTYTQNKQRENESARQQMMWELAAKRQDELDAQARQYHKEAQQRHAEQDAQSKKVSDLSLLSHIYNLGASGAELYPTTITPPSLENGWESVIPAINYDQSKEATINRQGLEKFSNEQGVKSQERTRKEQEVKARIEKLMQDIEASKATTDKTRAQTEVIENAPPKPTKPGKWKIQWREVVDAAGKPVMGLDGKPLREQWWMNMDTREWDKAVEPVSPEKNPATEGVSAIPENQAPQGISGNIVDLATKGASIAEKTQKALILNNAAKEGASAAIKGGKAIFNAPFSGINVAEKALSPAAALASGATAAPKGAVAAALARVLGPAARLAVSTPATIAQGALSVGDLLKYGTTGETITGGGEAVGDLVASGIKASNAGFNPEDKEATLNTWAYKEATVDPKQLWGSMVADGTINRALATPENLKYFIGVVKKLEERQVNGPVRKEALKEAVNNFPLSASDLFGEVNAGQ